MVRSVVAALNVLSFALYIGAPGIVHPCPAHSAPPSAASVSHHQHGVAHHQPADAPEKSGDDCCCPGPQCGGLVLALSLPAVSAGPAPVRERLRVPAEFRLATWRIERLLPFATAPPASPA